MRVMVGVDGSVRSQRALRWGLREAAARGGQVAVVHGFDVPRLRGPLNREVSLDTERAQARDRVEAMIARAGGPPVGVPVGIVTVAVADHANVAHLLVRHARSADLLVVGARGLGGFAGLLLGSVSQQVAAHAPVPVAVVPGAASARDDGLVATRSIVVGVDGSPQATAALRWAVDSAAARSCAVTAVYVYPPPAATLTAGIAGAVDRAVADGFWTHGRGQAEDAVHELVAKVAPTTDVTVHALVTPGVPAQRLLELAADHDALLVVGSRGHGGFPGLLLGSVSSQCLYHSPSPVVVVHR